MFTIMQTFKYIDRRHHFSEQIKDALKMRFTAYSYQRHSDIKNMALPFIVFLALSAALLGPLILSPTSSTSRSMHVSQNKKEGRALADAMSVDADSHHPADERMEHLHPKYKLVSNDGHIPERTVVVMKAAEESPPNKSNPYNAKKKPATNKRKLHVMQTLEASKEKVKEKVDHAKVANVISLSASAAILLGAFTAKRVAKRRLEVGGNLFESDSNVGRISDDIAYDIAYTTKCTSEVSYGSFAAPWTGDLEKFDV